METAIYQRTKLLCKKKNITLQQLTDNVGISASLIRKWGRGASPSIDKVRRIADFFDVSIDYLIGASDIPECADKVIGDTSIMSIQRARANMSSDDKELMMLLLRRTFEKAFESEQPKPEETE